MLLSLKTHHLLFMARLLGGKHLHVQSLEDAWKTALPLDPKSKHPAAITNRTIPAQRSVGM